jgi:N-formylglutamate amidohydrolase
MPAFSPTSSERPPTPIYEPDPPFEIVPATAPAAPLVFSSPHSGAHYSAAFLASSRLDPTVLRRSEDAFVDELFAAAAAANGAALVRALFPRAYVDPNREPWELDPAMFEGPLPAFVNRQSPRVAGGLGTVARVVANGAEIYRGKLDFAETRRRIEALYMPYHAALEALLARTQAQFGACLLVDCHSMPSVGGPMDRDPGRRRLDFVLGDCFGAACAPAVIATAESCLRDMGYAVGRNDPYAGGFITRHYGTPSAARHALQIEINRGLYMDELAIAKAPGFAKLAADLGVLVHKLADLSRTLVPRTA